MAWTYDRNQPGQTRPVTTGSAAASLGSSTFTNAVSALNAKFAEGKLITAQHLQDLADLMLQASGHTHTWTDQYGKKTYGSRNDEGYSKSGSTYPNSVYAINTDFGLVSGIGQDEIVRTSHHNYSRTIHNSLRSHKHDTDEATE